MKVLLLTALSDFNRPQYVDKMESAGYITHCHQIFTHRFFALDELSKALETSKILALTSKRAVEALLKLPSAKSLLKEKRVYVVGPSTAASCKNGFGITPILPEKPSAESLADLLLQCAEPFSDILFISGESSLRVLPERLPGIKEIAVYSSDLVFDFPPASSYDFVVVFSPRSLEVLSYWKDAVYWKWLVAIGPTTETAFKRAGIVVNEVAQAPSGIAVFEALERLKNKG